MSTLYNAADRTSWALWLWKKNDFRSTSTSAFAVGCYYFYCCYFYCCCCRCFTVKNMWIMILYYDNNFGMVPFCQRKITQWHFTVTAICFLPLVTSLEELELRKKTDHAKPISKRYPVPVIFVFFYNSQLFTTLT